MEIGASLFSGILYAAGCRLAGCGSSVPEAVLTNADLEKLVETNDEWIASRTGIRYCIQPSLNTAVEESIVLCQKLERMQNHPHNLADATDAELAVRVLYQRGPSILSCCALPA